MDEDPKSKSWWHTLPGVLTAGAGIVTAITALLTTLNQTGWLSRSPQAHTPAASGSIGTAAPAAPVVPSPAKATALVAVLPERPELVAGVLRYRVLQADLAPQNPGLRSLKLHIRVSNNDKYDANFWAASFRLLADGALLAPTSELNELVAGNSTRDGVVEFTVADTLARVELQMGNVGMGVAGLPLELKAAP